MKHLTLLAALAAMALTSCNPAKPTSSEEAEPEVIVVTSENAERVLNIFESNLRELQMLDNDVVDNVDAIIAIQERNSAIVHAIEADTLVLSPEQRERFNELKSRQQ